MMICIFMCEFRPPSLSFIPELEHFPHRPCSLAASSRCVVTTGAWNEPSWRASSSSQPSSKGGNRAHWFEQSGPS
ncbi:hypothetical protein Bca101_067481 [Brassica carinata]